MEVYSWQTLRVLAAFGLFFVGVVSVIGGILYIVEPTPKRRATAKRPAIDAAMKAEAKPSAKGAGR